MKKARDRSGQALLIGVLILMLLMITIPAVIFLNQHAASHGVESQRRLKARTVAEEGLAFGIQQLSQPGPPPNWPYLPGGILPPSGTFTSLEQSSFTITYTSTTVATPVLQTYQVQIIVRPTQWDPVNQQIVSVPGSSIAALVSQHTVGAQLPGGFSTSAAVQLGLAPNTPPGANFRVYWGPIVITNSGTPAWNVGPACPAAGTMNCDQFPRKFSTGAITGAAGGTNQADVTYTTDPNAPLTRCPPNGGNTGCAANDSATDEKEYWAYISPTAFVSYIDTHTYQLIAQAETNITPPICVTSAGIPDTPPFPPTLSATNCTPGSACGYFDVANCNNTGDAALFDGSPYAVPNSTDVIYVTNSANPGVGNVQFGNIAIDFHEGGGAFIVTGNLTVNGNASLANPTPQADIRLPPTAALDFPYTPGLSNYFSSICPNNLCNSSPLLGGTPNAGMNFRGFLYVQGNMTEGSGNGVAMDGVLRVDGQLNAPDLFVPFYDDVINHKILTTNFELQVDSMTAIP